MRLVVFDLDGTLIDGYAAIGDALGHAMKSLGLPAPDLPRVRAMVGHGLEKLLEQAAGPDLAAEGVRLFRERYPEVAVSGSELLPGVPEVLDALAARGLALAVASNKPPHFSRLILRAKGVADRFLAIEGPGPQTAPKPDPAMIADAMRRSGAEPGTTLVVGDMEVDFEFGRAAGCRVALIPSGSRTREELSDLGADALLGNIRDLPAWIDAAG